MIIAKEGVSPCCRGGPLLPRRKRIFLLQKRAFGKLTLTLQQSNTQNKNSTKQQKHKNHKHHQKPPKKQNTTQKHPKIQTQTNNQIKKTQNNKPIIPKNTTHKMQKQQKLELTAFAGASAP